MTDGKYTLEKEDYDKYYARYLRSIESEYMGFPYYVWEQKQKEQRNARND